jgi:SynChlorMet cassette protein ScmC
MNKTSDPIIPAFFFQQPWQAIPSMSPPQEAETYTLRLANGQSWDFFFTEGLRRWGRSFASIMNLGRTGIDHGRKLVFVDPPERDGSAEQLARRIECSILPNLQKKQEWNVHNPGPVRIWGTNSLSDKVIELLFLGTQELQTISMFFSLIPVYHAVISNGGLPFHAALVTRNGSGVLIAAAGGGGKSTCARRIPEPWQALCDDETIIVRDKGGRYVVHPFPTWSDRTSRRSRRNWDVQQYVPLQAIFFLEQSEEEMVFEVPKTQAAARAYKAAEQVSAQSFRGLDPAETRNFRQKLFENACELVRVVPTYVLRASRNGRFWEEMESVLSV